MSRKTLITIRRGTESQLNKITLAEGELGFTTDTHKLFIGNSNKNLLVATSISMGDMLKSVYDTNNDGIVDNARNAKALEGHSISDFMLKGALTWNQLRGK